MRLGCWGVGLLLTATGSTALTQPLHVVNNSPVTALYGLPGHREAGTLAAGQWAGDLQGTISNHFVDAGRRGESLFFDGETMRLDLRLRYAVTDRIELQLDLPWLRHEGGRLDNLIEEWHNVFGLPNGDRGSVPEDQLQFRYADVAGRQRVLGRATSGMGEPSVAVSYQAWSESGKALSVHLGAKVAGGDRRQWLSSGATDVFIGFRFTDESSFAEQGFAWHAQAGWLRLGQSSLLPVEPESGAWYLSASLDWAVNEDWKLVVQTDSHGGLYDSELRPLGKPTLQLSLGTHWRMSKNWRLQLGFSEDLAVDTSPDISFFSGLTYTP